MDKNKVDLQHTHWPRVSNRLYEVEKSAVILKLFFFKSIESFLALVKVKFQGIQRNS